VTDHGLQGYAVGLQGLIAALSGLKALRNEHLHRTRSETFDMKPAVFMPEDMQAKQVTTAHVPKRFIFLVTILLARAWFGLVLAFLW